MLAQKILNGISRIMVQSLIFERKRHFPSVQFACTPAMHVFLQKNTRIKVITICDGAVKGEDNKNICNNIRIRCA